MDSVRHLLDELLGLVQARSGFGLVMLTRVDGDDWTVVATTANPYGVADGDVFRWSASICSRMVSRADPDWMIDDVELDVDAAAAPVRAVVDIASYAGSPVVGADGALLGTVCAIDPEHRAASEVADLFAFAGRFGAYVLDQASASINADREAERRLFRAADALGATVVPAEAWSALLERESERCRWTSERLIVGLARVAGSDTARRQVQHVLHVLTDQLGPADAVSVLGSNRIGVMCIERDAAEVEKILGEIALDIEVASVVSEVAGSSAGAVVDDLETELVGASAAAARSSSRLVYAFCDGCGRKGVYRSVVANVTRCKFCGVHAA